MILDTAKMHSDILKKLNAIEKPQRYLTDKLGVSRATLFRMSKGKDLKIETFLKLAEWLDFGVLRYIY